MADDSRTRHLPGCAPRPADIRPIPVEYPLVQQFTANWCNAPRDTRRTTSSRSTSVDKLPRLLSPQFGRSIRAV